MNLEINRKPLLIILANESPNDHKFWLNACENLNDIIDYKVVNLSHNDWFEKVKENQNATYYLCKPPCITSGFKQLYDERLTILSRSMQLPVYPTLQECLIYENKRFLSYWLLANGIPHPKTRVFYFKQEALAFVNKQKLPIVAKVNIGASGSGVKVLRSKKMANAYIHRTFGGKGAKKRFGPNLEMGGLFRRGMHYFLHPLDLFKKINLYRTINKDSQTDFVIFQEYIPHDFEWRAVRIGNSFFAHKKIRHNETASGSLLKAYETPPFELLDFVKNLTDEHHFYSQAIDVFESSNGYLVNEMQCIFGQSDPYQMLVDGKKGRYIWRNEQWHFEEGDFTSNQCYDLRVEHVLNHFL